MAGVRRLFLSLLTAAVVLATACAPKGRPVVRPSDAPRSVEHFAALTARSLVGAPYRNGGADPDGFDCSGFVQYVFARLGVAIPRSVREQAAAGEHVERDDLREGDLVFFAIDGRTISHVGIVVSAGTFVHAPSSRGRVREEPLEAAYWRSRLADGRRVSRR